MKNQQSIYVAARATYAALVLSAATGCPATTLATPGASNSTPGAQAAAPSGTPEANAPKDKTNDAAGAKGSSIEMNLTVRGGYCRYAMTAFNHTEQSRRNNTISGGPCAGIEALQVVLNVPEKTPVLGGAHIRVPLIGIDYIGANAKTTSTAGGNSATVAWSLPVVGFYLPAEIVLKDVSWLRLRPIEIGYYPLGNVFNANLAISDRPGRLELTSKAVGYKTEILFGTHLDGDKSWLFASIGYRWLRFTDVTQKPTGGFLTSFGGPAATSGNLQSGLDYSGAFAMVGATF